MLQIDATQAGQIVEIAVGQVAELRLAENAGTGFRWQVMQDGGPNCRITRDFVEGDPARHTETARPGQGSAHVWQISGVQPGLCDLALSYRRPWETNTPPAASYTVRLRVSG